MGNLEALRDWGHAKDYVRMQWLMLQQNQPDDFVIATGLQFSVKYFIQMAAETIGLKLDFQGEGLDEIAVVSSIIGDNCPGLSVGDVIVRVDPKYFRPTEVESLLGDPSKAEKVLGWKPEITVKEMCEEMMQSDMAEAQKHNILKNNGYTISIGSE